MVIVRPAGTDDVAAILELWNRADAEPTVTDDEDALNALLAFNPTAVLLAVEERLVVGTLIVGWDGWRGGFYRLAVAPDYRRQGVARRLVERGESLLIDAGARRLSVFAVASDPRAVPFWQAVGYEAQSDRQRLVKNIVA